MTVAPTTTDHAGSPSDDVVTTTDGRDSSAVGLVTGASRGPPSAAQMRCVAQSTDYDETQM